MGAGLDSVQPTRPPASQPIVMIQSTATPHPPSSCWPFCATKHAPRSSTDALVPTTRRRVQCAVNQIVLHPAQRSASAASSGRTLRCIDDFASPKSTRESERVVCPLNPTRMPADRDRRQMAFPTHGGRTGNAEASRQALGHHSHCPQSIQCNAMRSVNQTPAQRQPQPAPMSSSLFFSCNTTSTHAHSDENRTETESNTYTKEKKKSNSQAWGLQRQLGNGNSTDRRISLQHYPKTKKSWFRRTGQLALLFFVSLFFYLSLFGGLPPWLLTAQTGGSVLCFEQSAGSYRPRLGRKGVQTNRGVHVRNI